MPSFIFREKNYNTPVELALDVLGGKYKMPILWRLKDKVWRYGELKKSIGGVTHKMLAEQLHQLEHDGLISRKVYPEVPPKVEYSITEKGMKAVPIIESLRNFGENFRKETINALE